ncbi:hypothetical protein EIO60_01617|nr:hypothetical protein [Candidatus Pantoea persica]
MAIIHYGKSVFVGNVRTRRHRRRQPLSRLKLSIEIRRWAANPTAPGRRCVEEVHH